MLCGGLFSLRSFWVNSILHKIEFSKLRLQIEFYCTRYKWCFGRRIVFR
jgi:hypothetical protein